MAKLSSDPKKRIQQFVAVIKKSRENGKTYQETIKTLVQLTRTETRDRSGLPISVGKISITDSVELMPLLLEQRLGGESLQGLVEEGLAWNKAEEIAILAAFKAEWMFRVKRASLERKRKSLTSQGIGFTVIGLLLILLGVGILIWTGQVFIKASVLAVAVLVVGLIRWVQGKGVEVPNDPDAVEGH